MPDWLRYVLGAALLASWLGLLGALLSDDADRHGMTLLPYQRAALLDSGWIEQEIAELEGQL